MRRDVLLSLIAAISLALIYVSPGSAIAVSTRPLPAPWPTVLAAQLPSGANNFVPKPPDDERTGLALRLIDRAGASELHEQVAAEIRKAIAEGEAKPGDGISHAKDLAAVLGVHTNTVLRALRVLRDEGLLQVGRGRAIRVRDARAWCCRRDDKGARRDRPQKRLSPRRARRDASVPPELVMLRLRQADQIPSRRVWRLGQ